MNTKTVKEKLEEIIKKQTLAIVCSKCNGGGYNYDKKENCEECDGTGLSEWRFGTAIDDIDKLYRKEMEKEIQSLQVAGPVGLKGHWINKKKVMNIIRDNSESK